MRTLALFGNVQRMWTPVSFRPFSLGNGLDQDDRKTLENMSDDELIVIGTIVSSGRYLSKGIIGGEFNPISSLVNAFVSAFTKASMPIPPDLNKVKQESDAVPVEARKTSNELTQKGDDILEAVSGILVLRHQDWKVSYRTKDGNYQIVAGRAETVSKEIVLDPPSTNLAGVIKYINDNKDIVERIKAKARMSGLGNPGWLILALLTIIGLVLIVTGIILLIEEQKQKWQDDLARRLGENVTTIQRLQSESNAMKIRVASIDAKGAAATPEEQQEKAELEKKIQEIDGLIKGKEAENEEIQKALEKARETANALILLLEALGVRSALKWIVIAGGVLLLSGLAIYTLRYALTPLPKPKKA